MASASSDNGPLVSNRVRTVGVDLITNTNDMITTNPENTVEDKTIPSATEGSEDRTDSDMVAQSTGDDPRRADCSDDPWHSSEVQDPWGGKSDAKVPDNLTLQDIMSELADIKSMLRHSRRTIPNTLKTQPESKEEIEAETLEEAAEKNSWVQGIVKSWRADKGFGFVTINQRQVFAHISSIQGTEEGIVGQQVYLQVLADKSRCAGSFRAQRVRRSADHLEQLAKEKAHRLAAESIRAAEATKLAMEAAEDASTRASWLTPPGLTPTLSTTTAKPQGSIFGSTVIP